MPYIIVKRKGARPWKIVRADTKVVVGSSLTKAEAQRSIGYRMEAENKKRGLTNKGRGRRRNMV